MLHMAAGMCYSLQCHIVWCTKYRKPLFVSDLENEVKKSLEGNRRRPSGCMFKIKTVGNCKKHLQAKIITMEVMPD